MQREVMPKGKTCVLMHVLLVPQALLAQVKVAQ
jgi:hypothetical protein